MAALTAEFEVGRIGSAAAGTDQFKLGAAFPAEFETCWVLALAFPAFHDFPRRAVGRRATETVLNLRKNTMRWNE